MKAKNLETESKLSKMINKLYKAHVGRSIVNFLHEIENKNIAKA